MYVTSCDTGILNILSSDPSVWPPLSRTVWVGLSSNSFLDSLGWMIVLPTVMYNVCIMMYV